MDGVVVVFTFRPWEMIVAQGGSQAWAINPRNASDCKYLVCTRSWREDGHGPEPERSAFLVGKISGVAVSPERDDRYIIQISEFARLDPPIPEVWVKGDRFPVRYRETMQELDIELSKLVWEPIKVVPPTGRAEIITNSATQTSENIGVRSLTLSQAKQIIAQNFGISPDCIEIRC
jgi:hypothetical protein